MATEIEHKYLIDHNKLLKDFNPKKEKRITQGYLSMKPTVRVRLVNKDEAFLTVKGSGTVSRAEFEYAIPYKDGEAMIKLTPSVIVKTRYEIKYGSHIWEVDKFLNTSLVGLWLAEIELSSENEEYEKPPWVFKNVSDNKLYSNSNLIVFGIPKE